MVEIPFSIIADVLTKLGSSGIQRIGSAFGVGQDLTKLTKKLDTVRGVLVDAEERQEKSYAVKAWVRRLKDVLYDADDLLDDFEMLQLQKHGVARQVSHFFSSSNQLIIRFKMSNRVKNIKAEVDEIVKEIPMLSLIQGNIIQREADSSWRETHSLVLTSQIVGREENKEEIIKSLVSSDNQEILSMVAIVGIGGLGKITLAQLLYNDPIVVEYFELKIWVCVSDPFDVKVLVKKILKEVCDQNVERLKLNGLKNLLHEKLSQKRCLLALDDVWNENYEKWDKLKSLLMVVGKGSKILVTTRHAKVASIMGIDSPFVLEGTQPWDLFAKIAFTEEPGKVHSKFVEIGKEIVNMCNGVSLIIKTFGTVLRLKPEESYWLSIKNNDNLLSLRDGSDDVLLLLKLSYDNLPLPLKRCFAYCALFPKDYKIEKEWLVQMWMAQGYIQPLDEGKGAQYFDKLLSRSLLEVFEKDADNNISSCKMHDLIHDLAQLVIGSEVLILEDDAKHISKEVHHISMFKPMINIDLKTSKVKHLRTFLSISLNYIFGDAFILGYSSFKCLRVLSLNGYNIVKVSKSIGKLNHLRYLDLSNNRFEVLPNSITSLKNLQTLKLFGCSNLKELPKDTRELINLRYLEDDWCLNLSHMPCGLGELTMLQSLPIFVVGNGRGIGRLSELKGLNNLRGELRIERLGNMRDNAAVESKEANLKEKQHIQTLIIRWERSGGQSGEDAESVLEGLQPHSNLKQLYIEGYGGERFPSWMMNGGLSSILPNLTSIDLSKCSRCQTLPCFVRLPRLKSLKLYHLAMVEHMEEHCSSEGPFFPSLQELSIYQMPKLKELWRIHMDLPTSFPCLTRIRIEYCKDLASLELPPSPLLSGLDIKSSHELESLKLHSSPLLSALSIQECPKLTSLQVSSLPCLKTLELAEVRGEVLRLLMLSVTASSLESLSIYNIDDLRTLPDELHQHVSTLQILQIGSCPQLKSLPEEFGFLRLLQSLSIEDCSGLIALPDCIGSLPSLKHLEIGECPQLTSLPEGMRSLTTLETLSIFDCAYLSERCQSEEGEDWPKIAHVEKILIDGARV